MEELSKRLKSQKRRYSLISAAALDLGVVANILSECIIWFVKKKLSMFEPQTETTIEYETNEDIWRKIE